jgi:DNA repair exonuclease SbcCD ATPase subunit
MAKKTKDDLIQELLLKVEEKKKQIDRIKNPVFKTNLSFNVEMFGIASRVNLNVASEEILFSLLTYLNLLIDNRDVVNEKYGISCGKDWYGFKLEEWRDDIVLKIKQKQCQTQVAELKSIEAKLQSLISEDKKKDIELENISKLLGV